MGIVSIIGPKGGIGKTTLAINITAAMTQALAKGEDPGRGVCLVDLDLRLPTISSLLDSHPSKTFYDLFETLANKTHQADFLHSLYQIVTRFQAYLEGSAQAEDRRLNRCFGLYKNIDPDLFQFGEFDFGDLLHELILARGEVHTMQDLPRLGGILNQLDAKKFRAVWKKADKNSRPLSQEFVYFIEEYGFSIIGGEVPVLGKRAHRKRVNEPALLLLFLEFLNQVVDGFDNVVLDTPAGGVNHLSSLMNVIDHVLFVFDLSNPIALNGSIDALHSFIDYYEDFFADFEAGRLTGLDKDFANRLVSHRGKTAILDSLRRKRFGILFNRCSATREATDALQRLRDYLDTLDKYEAYKDRIQIMGMLPHHRIINITNNRGALFYNKDLGLTQRMDRVAQGILDPDAACPSLGSSDKEILQYLGGAGHTGLSAPLARIASVFG